MCLSEPWLPHLKTRGGGLGFSPFSQNKHGTLAMRQAVLFSGYEVVNTMNAIPDLLELKV